MKALFVVDMVNGFTRPETKDGKCALYLDKAQSIIPAINDKIKALDRDDVLVIIRDCHHPKAIEFDRFPEHCLMGTDESLLDKDINVRKDYIDFPKNFTNVWHETDFPYRMVSLDVDEVEVCGVVTEICVAQAAMGAANYGFKVKIDTKCVAAIDECLGQMMLHILEKYYNTEVDWSEVDD